MKSVLLKKYRKLLRRFERELFFQNVAGLGTALSFEMRCISNFHPVIVYPQVYEVVGFAADDNFVVAGMFHLRPEISAHQRMGHEIRLG